MEIFDDTARRKIISERFGIFRNFLLDLEVTANEHTLVRFPNSSTYIFSTGKTFWLVDPSFNYFDCKENDPELEEIARLINEKISVIAVTHLHADHCQAALAQKISAPAVKWIVSTRFAGTFQDICGVPPEQTVALNDGESYEFQGIRFTAQTGYHDEPGKADVPSCSYDIRLPDGIKLFMPADARNFLREIPDMSDVDYTFGHVFLGREDATGSEFSKLTEFCEFVSRRNCREIILAHMYESGRMSRDLWTHRHAEMIRAELQKTAPQIIVHAPCFGDIMQLKGQL